MLLEIEKARRDDRAFSWEGHEKESCVQYREYLRGVKARLRLVLRGVAKRLQSSYKSVPASHPVAGGNAFDHVKR